ncbi:hypothetical protein NQ315_014648 [Exocentrus adspersus]|uniref:RNase H type-1 domain-containing protein n=1 Tax=Exocentrus adspersus TaxID=1586481 RepID=A0AAV8VQW1_9CUCU|nr:hypothetical protein NQ315_014648 [Exocentrus adspersus]
MSVDKFGRSSHLGQRHNNSLQDFMKFYSSFRLSLTSDGNIDASNLKICNVNEPTQASDVTTKKYVDMVQSNQDVLKQAVQSMKDNIHKQANLLDQTLQRHEKLKDDFEQKYQQQGDSIDRLWAKQHTDIEIMKNLNTHIFDVVKFNEKGLEKHKGYTEEALKELKNQNHGDIENLKTTFDSAITVVKFHQDELIKYKDEMKQALKEIRDQTASVILNLKTLNIATDQLEEADQKQIDRIATIEDKQQLSRLQRLACISVTGATRSAPTEALEALLSLPRLHIEAEAGAMRASYRVKQWGQWRGRVQDGGHVSVLSQLVERDKLLEAPSDKIPPTYVFKKNFTVEIPSREVWNRDSDALVSQGLVCQAALHALKSPRITSQVVLECTNSLAELGQRNKVRLVWVPGHCGVTGNEEADALARKGSSDTFTGPEPAVGLPYSYPQGSIDNRTREKCQVDWSRGIGLRQARLLIKGPGAAATRSLVNLNRANIKIITGLLTGHGRLNKHLNTIGLSPDSRCKLCGTSDEDSVHVLCDCPRVIVNRHKHFGAGYLAPEDIREIPVDKVLAFARSTGLF